jgi:hypothetical protein
VAGVGWTPVHYVPDIPKLSYTSNTNEEKYVIQLSNEREYSQKHNLFRKDVLI